MKCFATCPSSNDSLHIGGITLQTLCANEYFESAKALVDFGSNVNHMGGGGRSPLHWAAICDNSRLLQHMFEHGGADLNLRCEGDHGWTPLHEAVAHRRLAAARTLIALGADVNAKDDFGRRPIDLFADNWDPSLRSFMEEKMVVQDSDKAAAEDVPSHSGDGAETVG